MKPELVTVSNVRWFIPAIKVWQVSMVPLTPSVKTSFFIYGHSKLLKYYDKI